MTFVVETGRIEISDPYDRVVFSSFDGLFHTISVVTASVAVPAISFFTNTYVNTTTSWLLGACDPACTDIIGSLKFTLGSPGAGLAFDRWHSIIGGGSVIWVIDGHGLVGTSPDPNNNINQIIVYDLRIDAGNVYLDRRAYCSDLSRGTYTVLGHTIDFYLECGLYS